jgi:hypothetical protein
VVGGHTTSLGATEFGEYRTNAYIVYFSGVEVGKFSDGSFEDLSLLLVLGDVQRHKGRAYCSQKFMLVRISESTFFCSRDWCAECREEDYIVWILLEDVLEAFLDESHSRVGGCAATLKTTKVGIKSMVEARRRSVKI